jgi:hypothetical protein
MAIPDSDPRAQDLDAAFAQAMEGPARPRVEAKTPGEVDHDAPFGREDDGTAKAPYGLTKDGKPKRTRGGRPPKGEQPRTGEPVQPEDARPPAARPEPHDWTPDLDGFADGVWFGLSALGKVTPKIPVVGKILPGEKLAAEAFILAETKPRLIAAVNLAAQHNARAAAFCGKLQGGDGLWALTCMFMIVPVINIGLTVWKGDEADLKEAELPTLAEMSRRNDDKMGEMVARINAQITAATQAAMATTPEAAPAAG